MEFTTVSKEIIDTGIKCLIYGESGVGKTVLSVTAPRPIIISREGGLLSLQYKNIVKMFGENNPTITYDPPVIKITSLQDLVDAGNWCANPENQAYFDTIIIDSLSEIAEMVLENAKGQVKDQRKAYMEVVDQMEPLVKAYRDIPAKNVVMIAKSEMSKDETTGITMKAPAMPGTKLGPKLPYLFDEIFKMEAETSKEGGQIRYLVTKKDVKYVAKDRSGCLDEYEPAHLGHIFNKIKGVQNNG